MVVNKSRKAWKTEMRLSKRASNLLAGIQANSLSTTHRFEALLSLRPS